MNDDFFSGLAEISIKSIMLLDLAIMLGLVIGSVIFMVSAAIQSLF